jgi:hypothetical protein
MTAKAITNRLKSLERKASWAKDDALEIWFCINGRWYTSEALNIRLEAEMAGEDPEAADIGPGLSEEEYLALHLSPLSRMNATGFVGPEHRQDANAP